MESRRAHDEQEVEAAYRENSPGAPKVGHWTTIKIAQEVSSKWGALHRPVTAGSSQVAKGSQRIEGTFLWLLTPAPLQEHRRFKRRSAPAQRGWLVGSGEAGRRATPRIFGQINAIALERFKAGGGPRRSHFHSNREGSGLRCWWLRCGER